MIATIALDDGLILPHSANPTGSNFRERQADRHDPTGMSRPHDCVRGGAPAPNPWEVAAYYNESRIHRSLNKDAPFHRAIERVGAITSQPVLGVFITNIAESDFRTALDLRTVLRYALSL
jgi:hypothetical protein